MARESCNFGPRVASARVSMVVLAVAAVVAGGSSYSSILHDMEGLVVHANGRILG